MKANVDFLIKIVVKLESRAHGKLVPTETYQSLKISHYALILDLVTLLKNYVAQSAGDSSQLTGHPNSTPGVGHL